MAHRINPLWSIEGAQQQVRSISLAHEQPFALGALTVDPGTRRISHCDGREEFVEPRVMQVLVALAQARGAILPRDDLIELCWGGRIIGEDAITRVISRLRRLSDTIGRGIFTIETLTKVGYRLVLDGTGDTRPPVPLEASLSDRPPSRRAFMAGGAAAGVAALAGGLFFYLNRQRSPSTGEAEALMALAWHAWTQGTREGSSQAIGLYRRAITVAPDHADAWGFLGAAYADRSHSWARAAEREPLRERARAAGRRALELDPKNAYGRGALAYARPMMGNWLLMEREFSRGLQEQPDKWCINYSLALAHTRVGRFTEAAARFAQVRNIAPTATQFLFEAQSLWGAGRLDEAERLIDEAVTIYATNPRIWSARVNLLLFSGRPGAAIALTQDVDMRPADLPVEDIEDIVTVGKALESGSAAVAAAAMDRQVGRVQESAIFAPYAIQAASALGRVDEAFMLANAYFFSRGFIVPDEQAAEGHVPNVSLNERRTAFLFMPPTRAMQTDPRFAQLVHDLKLELYWQQADAQPDFRRASHA